MTEIAKHPGRIEVICGPMFCGKTEELIRRLKRAQIAKMQTAIFKPIIDIRYSDEHIVSHNLMKLTSVPVNHVNEIIEMSREAQVVGIDEAQFFSDDLVAVCRVLANQNKRVIVAGLDKDYRAKPFGPMPEIMCEADYLDKLQAICLGCGEPASYTYRLTADSEQIVIGETDKYEARCRRCYSNSQEKQWKD